MSPLFRIARSGSSQKRSGPRRVFRTKGLSEGGSGRGPEVVRHPACQKALPWRDGCRTRTAGGARERGRPDRTEREKPPQATIGFSVLNGYITAHYTFKRQAACRKRRASFAERRRRRHLRFARVGGPRTLTRECLPDPSAGAGGAPREPRRLSSCVSFRQGCVTRFS